MIVVRNISVHIFENPSFVELIGLDMIRFIALNKEKKVYVWDGTKAFHSDISVALGLNDSYSDQNFLRGQALRKNDEFIMFNSDFFNSFKISKYSAADERFLKSFFIQDWSWLDKYIKASDWINHKKEHFIGNQNYGATTYLRESQ